MKRLSAVAAVVVALSGGVLVANETVLAQSCPTVAPGQSFQTALLAADPGCVITVQAGNYPEQVIQGTTKAVTFQGEPGVVIQGDLASGPPTSACNGSDNVTFRGMQATWLVTRCGAENVVFDQMRGGSVNFNEGPVVLRGSDVGGLFVNAVGHIKQGAQDILIENTVFHDFLINDPAKHSECLMLWEGAGNLTIRNSVFRNCTDFGILVKSVGAQNVIIEDSFFEEPMTGDVRTDLCSPNCGRSGSSIRYSGVTNTYPGSAVRNNIVNGGVSIDCNCVPLSNNRPGEVPLVPPGSTTPPPPPPPAQCSDTIDNDGDGLIDMDDPGCSGPNDDDEFNDPPPPPPPPPPDPDRAIFCDELVPGFQGNPYYNKWTAQNPGERSRWEPYRDAVCAGQNPASPAMLTLYGKGLVAGGKMATG